MCTTTYRDGKEGWVLDTFQETVPMSTYLVAFMISEFEYVESVAESSSSTSPSSSANSSVLFRIWSRKEAIHQADLAKDVGPKVLTYFSDYFNTEYPLPKQDMVAIPDFNAGAMENWGLITYRLVCIIRTRQ